MYVERILCYGQWQRIFCLVETIFCHSYFLKQLLELEGGQYLKKNLIPASENHFRQFLSDPDSNGSSLLV